ncbi:MAG: low temperature requirement protein A, partial [Actinomycetota bacterium]|nr:low temperature requirement protein A [Actinomycetota bacterium]
MSGARPGRLLRAHAGAERATNVELFFDLVYVFAVTQLSHRLLTHPRIEGALQTLALFGMVWLVWAYTTWVTNWLDPERLPVRSLLLALMLGSLVMSAALPRAFAAQGLAVGCAYAGMQIGRSIFAVIALRGERLQRNFDRILAWCVLSGALAIAGGIAPGHVRELLWLLVVLVDVSGGLVGFYTPGLGRSSTTDWDIEGNHFAERCQAFLLISLGESVVVIGTTLSGLRFVAGAEILAFLLSCAGAGALWWIYFDRSAEESMGVIAASPDPGRLGRSAYHLLHPVMVAGIIVTAAADERVLTHPSAAADTATALMVLGGSALFIAGHAGFKAVVWRVWPTTRVGAIVVLGLLG